MDNNNSEDIRVNIIHFISSCLTAQSIVTYILVALFTWIAYTQFIRPVLSPLRKIPGTAFKPIIGDVGNLLTDGPNMEPNLKILDIWHEKFGTICRWYDILGTTNVQTTDIDTIKHIFITNNRNYKKPDDVFKEVFKKILGDGLITLEGSTHATHRRLISPSFNNASIKKMLPIFENIGKKLTKLWISHTRSDGHVKLEIQNDLSNATLDIIGQAAFGYCFNSLENSKSEVVKAFRGILEGSTLKYIWKMTLPYYHKLPFPDVLKLKRAIKVMQATVSDIIKKKRKQIEQEEDLKEVSSDILGIMMLAKDESTGEGLSDEELRNEVSTLMSAGHETTSTGMAWFLKAMADHPDIQAKCREEIKMFLPTVDSPITMEVLDKLQYLDLCIKETLRMYPPVPATYREAINDDCFMSKYTIPAGTIVIIPMMTIMHDADNFDDPEMFRPERFDVPEDEASKTLYRFIPFLMGPRICVGYKFALLQMKAIIACLLRELNFSPIPGTSFYASYANFVTMRPSPPLVLDGSKIE